MPHQSDLVREPLSRLLRGRREVAIGARARRQRWIRLAIALIGVTLIVGACWLYQSLASLARPAHETHVALVARCVECGRESIVHVAAEDASRVVECPQCKARAAYKLWQCRKCGERFLPPITAGAAVIRCPRCQGTDVGTAGAAVSQPAGGSGSGNP